MNRTSWVIQVLDDSNRRSIEYENRTWLRQNVETLGLCVCVEDCGVDVFGIAKSWGEEGTMLIQEGKRIQFQADFHPGKEALLVRKLYPSKPQNLVFLYSPKDWKVGA